MRTLIFVLLLALQTVTQPEDYPGQHDHAQPPDGWMCEHQNYELSVPPAHACNCERSCDTESGRVIEDKQCKVYCHMDHCHCQIANESACGHPQGSAR